MLNNQFFLKVQKAEAAIPQVCTSSEEISIPGLSFYPVFVTEDQERDLLGALEGVEWNRLAKRSVCHFGNAFDYVTRSVSSRGCIGPIPDLYSSLIRRMESLSDVPKV
jgi:hypothetical protein